MKTSVLLLPSLLALPVLAMAAMLWPQRAFLLHLDPPPERRLLVAIDMVTGAARGLQLADSEKMCLAMAGAPAWPALAQLKTGERLDCRVPK